MIEPTETESKETLDAFIEVMIEAAALAKTNPGALHLARSLCRLTDLMKQRPHENRICAGNQIKNIMKTFRLIRSKAGNAAYNMTLDKGIFLRYLEDGIPVLRLYSWEAPSLTYGISQKPGNEINLNQCNRDGVQVAQRMTGGGVLFHHNEITYSLVCSKEDIGEEEKVFVSYRHICAFLMYFYKSLGLKASFAFEADDFKNKGLPHELCSAAHEKYDIVIGKEK